MTDRPILFSGPMVRAILEGRKTQTRRVIKHHHPEMPEPHSITPNGQSMICRWHSGIRHDIPAPFAVGDRLWVREAWHTSKHYDDLKPSEMGGEEPICFEADDSVTSHGGKVDDLDGRRRPGMFMPRWASRLTLIVTDVRAERVQGIRFADAVAEGCKGWVAKDGVDGETPSEQFQDLWNSLNGPRGHGWDSNPWVVAITFGAHRTNIDQMTEGGDT